MSLVSIDPGKRKIAWAIWFDRRLVECGLSSAPSGDWAANLPVLVRSIPRSKYTPFDTRLRDHWRVVIELPRVYPRDRGARPNDLIDLAAAAGACTALGRPEFVHPRTWKGSVPKEVMGQRILLRLADAERKVHDIYEAKRPRAKKPNHDVLDAIGVGLWKLRRL